MGVFYLGGIATRLRSVRSILVDWLGGRVAFSLKEAAYMIGGDSARKCEATAQRKSESARK